MSGDPASSIALLCLESLFMYCALIYDQKALRLFRASHVLESFVSVPVCEGNCPPSKRSAMNFRSTVRLLSRTYFDCHYSA